MVLKPVWYPDLGDRLGWKCTLVLDGNGWFCIIAIHKEISIFAFNFNSICLLRTSRWRTCEKVTACKKVDENITGGVKYR